MLAGNETLTGRKTEPCLTLHMAASLLEIGLLGRFRIVIDGVAVEDRAWTRRKSKTLIKLLALQPLHQLHREQVMEFLWPEQEPEAALNNLHKTIHAARRALDPNLKAGADSQFILTQGQQVLLRAPGGVRIDVEEFERRASEALRASDPAAGESALELYEGDLLSEDLYEDWAAARREQLRMLHEQLLGHLARLHEARGSHPQSIERWNQLVAANPSNEGAHRNLMRLYVVAGSRHQALQQYQLCRDVLRRELDLEPERATIALYEQIVAERGQLLSPHLAVNEPSTGASTVLELREDMTLTNIAALPVSVVLAESNSRRSLARFGGIGAIVFLLAVAAVWFYSRDGRAPEAASLIVLPFINESADQNLEYLSDGIAESVINNLTQLNTLRVMARTTAFRYKGRANDPQSVGHDLNVEAVLTGKLQSRGDTLIVQADLVRVSDGSQLWGEQYNLKTTDAFTIQQRISQEITEKLRMRLTNEQARRLAKNAPVNPDAYQHYLRGRYHWDRRTLDEIKKAIEHFNQAIAADRGYALAYAGLADAYNTLSNINQSPNECIPVARANAIKALELDDQLAEAHTALAYIKWRYDWDWNGANAEFNRALELNPNYPTAHRWYGQFLCYQKKFEAGRAEFLKAQQLDPLSLVINAGVGLSYYAERQYEPAIEQLRRTLELDPGFPYGHIYLGWALEQKKDFAQAIASFQRITPIGMPIKLAYLAHAQALAGNRAEAEKILADLQRQSKTDYVSPYYLAVIYVGLGENDKALDFLQQGITDRSDMMVILGIEPKFDALRSSPRFGEILNRIGLKP